MFKDTLNSQMRNSLLYFYFWQHFTENNRKLRLEMLSVYLFFVNHLKDNFFFGVSFQEHILSLFQCLQMRDEAIVTFVVEILAGISSFIGKG